MIHDGRTRVSAGALSLREVDREDYEKLFFWRAHPASRDQFRSTEPISRETHRAFLEGYFAADNDDRWYIVEFNNEPVGTISLYRLSADGVEAEWGRFIIDPDRRGQGLGGHALRLLMGHSRDLGIRVLHCEVLAGNAPAAHLYRACGFREIGSEEHVGRRFLRLTATLERA